MKTKVTLVLAILIAAPVFAQTGKPVMKAVVVNEYGGPEVLKYQDAPRPEPKGDEILVRVMAAAVNPVDSYVRQGMFAKRGLDNRPAIIGYDIAGVVEKTGADIKKFKAGDAVYSYLSIMRGGAYAEFAIAKESETALNPGNINFAEAAAVPLAATEPEQSLVVYSLTVEPASALPAIVGELLLAGEIGVEPSEEGAAGALESSM